MINISSRLLQKPTIFVFYGLLDAIIGKNTLKQLLVVKYLPESLRLSKALLAKKELQKSFCSKLN